MSIDHDFVQFCRQATDKQLENILAFEYPRDSRGDYESAVKAATERGWAVDRGKRV